MDQNNNRSPCKKPDLIRKKRKPLMEKRRRARINASLEQLKKLVLDATRKDSARYSKLEKADILELTVRHLRDIQRISMSCALSRNPHVLTQFNDGFVECSAEVDRYLSSSNGVSRDTHMRLLSHLSTLNQKGRIAAQLSPSPGESHGLGLPNMSVFLQSGVGGDQVCNAQPMGIHSPTHSPPAATQLQILPGTLRSTHFSTSSPTSSSSSTTTNLQEHMWSYHNLPMSPPSSPRDELHENIIKHKAPMGLQRPHTLPPAMKEYISSCRPQQEHHFKTFPLVSGRPDPSNRDHREHLMKPIEVEDQISMERLFRERQQGHDLSARGVQMFKGVDENVWRPW